MDGAYFDCNGDSLGFLPLWKIEEILKSGDFISNIVNEDTGCAELYVNQDLYVSYDSPETYALKFDYAEQSCFRGIMWWSADMKEDPIYFEMNAAPSQMPVPSTAWPSISPSLAPTTFPTQASDTESPTQVSDTDSPTQDVPTSDPTRDGETLKPTRKGAPTSEPTDDAIGQHRGS